MTANLNAAAIGKRLASDNRFLVACKDPADATKVLVNSGVVANGAQLRFSTASNVASTAKGTAAVHNVPPVPGTDTAAYYASVPGTDNVVAVPVDVTAVGSVSPYVRKQLFTYFDTVIGGVRQKWCYTDIYGTPLTSAGVPIVRQDPTTGVWTRGTVKTDAADANAVALSAAGSAIGNGFQPGLPVGVYTFSPQASGYAPHPGWTAQQNRAA